MYCQCLVKLRCSDNVACHVTMDSYRKQQKTTTNYNTDYGKQLLLQKKKKTKQNRIITAWMYIYISPMHRKKNPV